MKHVIKISLAGLAVLIVFSVLAMGIILEIQKQDKETIIFSPKTALSNTWERYKEEYLEPETYRTLDKGQGNITTSEGQSYTMLRAVWMDDKETFDRSWQWTKDNLQREDDSLFYWLFGEKSDGTYGILTERNGQNTASDADTDIAVALMFAYARWNEVEYLEQAQDIVQSIWNEEVVIINGDPYLAANNAEKNAEDPEIVINPSYLSPYAYRMFEEIDPGNDWEKLIDTSYEVLDSSIQEPLDNSESAHIPPDWVAIDRNTGRMSKAEDHNTNFSFDAMRVPMRLALDWEWYGEPRAKNMLNRMDFFKKEWRQEKNIYQSYGHNGELLLKEESPAIYGGTLGYFIVSDEKNAEQVYERKIKPLYNPDTASWKMPLGYYSENWAWFGFALYHKMLPNLWELIEA